MGDIIINKATAVSDPITKLIGEWAGELDFASILLRIFLAVLLAAVIGCERSQKRHAAGLRTFIVVSLAAASAMMTDIYLSEVLPFGFAAISAAAVIGVAIISSNTILYSAKSQIKGLTTSVGLWASGIIGLAVGAGFYTVALIGFAALMVCLSLLTGFERYLKNKSNHFEIHLELKSKGDLQDFVATIRRLGLKIDDIEANPAYINSGLSVYSVSLTISSAELKKYKRHSEIIEALSSLDYVNHIEEIN